MLISEKIIAQIDKILKISKLEKKCLWECRFFFACYNGERKEFFSDSHFKMEKSLKELLLKIIQISKIYIS